MSQMPERIDSKYRYVLLASNRAEQLIQGASPKGDIEERKPTRVALSEISEELVEWDYGPEEEPEEELAEAPSAEAEATES